MSDLLEWVEDRLKHTGILKHYWNVGDDHADLKDIIEAIDKGGGQTTDVPGVLRELHKIGFIIRKIKNEK
jgi:hypothetical protein